MIVKLLTEHHLEFLSLKGGCRCSSESTHSKIPHCWKSHALAHIIFAPSLTFTCLSLSYIARDVVTCTVDWPQSLKQFFINVSFHILIASLTLMALS